MGRMLGSLLAGETGELTFQVCPRCSDEGRWKVSRVGAATRCSFPETRNSTGASKKVLAPRNIQPRQFRVIDTSLKQCRYSKLALCLVSS